ncbi:MAG: PadR family transcriptional regulator [Chloroflexi bacterium]|nr:PadR family transcriptional regulator [Chloroflexota bacterium]
MTIRHAILGLLAQHPRHGYELRAAFEALVGGDDVWDVKPAQIYTTLARLEESGLIVQDGVEQAGGPEKHIYSLSPSGQEELERWYLSGIPEDHQHDEFFVKLMLSIGEKSIDSRQVIQVQRSLIYQDLHQLTGQRNNTNPRTELAQIFLLDKAIMHLEADLRWLDMIDSRLEEIQKQPMPEPEQKQRGRPRKNPSLN